MGTPDLMVREHWRSDGSCCCPMEIGNRHQRRDREGEDGYGTGERDYARHLHSQWEASRNIIAHSYTLAERELTRVRMYLQDWTLQVR